MGAHSLDREAVRYFCSAHAGSEKQEIWHRFTQCYWKNFDLRLTFWHHFGMHQAGYGDDKQMGLEFEDRLEKLVVPQTEAYGKPDLLIFTSGIWGMYRMLVRPPSLTPAADIQYLATLLRNKAVEQGSPSTLTFNELLWHRTRLEQAVVAVREHFPDTPLLYRTTTEHKSDSRVVDYPVAVFQLNQSARALMQARQVPLFHCESTSFAATDFGAMS